MTYGVTTKEIKGARIETIPVGTRFTLDKKGQYYTNVSGLRVSSLWNDEFEIVWDDRVSNLSMSD